MKNKPLVSPEKQSVPTIPEGGTLGILAYGWRGIMLWREERHRCQLARQLAHQKMQGRDEEK
jgi:hypothetical protein